MKLTFAFLGILLGSTLSFAATGEEAAVSETALDGSMSQAVSPYGNVTGLLAIGSDYISRGVTTTGHRPAAQLEVDYSHPAGAYLGVWASNVNAVESPARAEVEGWAGYSYNLTSSLSIQAGVTYEAYFRGSDANMFEFPLQISWNDIKVGVAYDPHWGGGDFGHAWYVSAGYTRKLPWQASLNLNAGYSFFAQELELRDYADFRAGVSRELFGLNVDASGYFVSARQFDGNDDPRAVFTISKAF